MRMGVRSCKKSQINYFYYVFNYFLCAENTGKNCKSCGWCLVAPMGSTRSGGRKIINCHFVALQFLWLA
jgi:hypothetical protein